MAEIILEHADRIKGSGTVSESVAWGDEVPLAAHDQLFKDFKRLISDATVAQLFQIQSDLQFAFTLTPDQRGQLEDCIASKLQACGLEGVAP